MFPPVESSGNPALESVLNSEDAMIAFENRIIMHASPVDSVDFTAHFLTTAQYSTRNWFGEMSSLFGIEPTRQFRHPDLQWDWKKADETGEFLTGASVLDRLSLEWSGHSTSIGIGRQAIGLSDCFFLTANDFFEPLAAEAFYRDYKPGVDSAVIRHYTGALAETALFAVAGYHHDGSPDWDESALIAQTTFTAFSFQWRFLGGKLPWRMMAGAAFQGEIGHFGVRAEGHINFPQNGYETAFGVSDANRYVHVSGGIDYRFANSLHLFAEYMYRSNGVGEYADFIEAAAASGVIRETYSAKHYAAVAANYQWHPLLTSQAFGMVNLDDSSAILSLFNTYSLSNEADLVFGGYYPVGDKPGIRYGFPVPESEFGSRDRAVSVELRMYL